MLNRERREMQGVPDVPSRQSRQISSFSVYTLMLYGSIPSTVTLRFFRYLSSILYGCLAPVVSKSIITSVGPLVLSGFAAGPSVEGPRAASVSVRFSSLRLEGCVLSAALISPTFVDSTGASWGAPESLVVVFVVAGAPVEDGRFVISTALEDSVLWPGSICDAGAAA